MEPWASPSARGVAASSAAAGTAFEVRTEGSTANGVSSFPSSVGSGRDAKPVLPTAVEDGAEEVLPGAG
ncbi:hypothetical protein [Streptomyces sp. NPDC050388]|uniref:hypothetical protein n=1 Tax=Streptomyces sp. NPDC050388 TaxID=3155781 RepID=UPI0034440A36